MSDFRELRRQAAQERARQEIAEQKRRDLVVVGMFLVLLVLAVGGLAWGLHDKHQCEAKGGAYLWREATCIKAQVIH